MSAPLASRLEPSPQPMGPESSGAWCSNHPGRESIGLCVRCRRGVCAECSTRVEGINYCRACLKALETGPSPATALSTATRPWPPVAHGLMLFVVVTAMCLVCWLLIEALS